MDRQHEVFAVAILFFFLTWSTVGLRCYVCGKMMKTWGRDDWYMVASLLAFTVYIAFQITAAVYGTGRHRWELSDHDAKIALLFWYLCELFYVITSCLLKFAIGYFYLRVAIKRWHIWCIRLLMVGTILCGLIYFFLVIFQCIPIPEFWNNHPASNKCLPVGPTLGTTYALAAVNAAADWTFGILPFFIVWDLRMELKTKLLVCGILAFAAIGSTATVVRMFYIHTLKDGTDFLYSTTDIAIWSTVEPGVGITAGSIACLRPLFQIWLWRLGLADAPRGRSRTYHPSSSEPKRRYRRGYRRSLSPSDLVPTDVISTRSTEVFGPKAPPRNRMEPTPMNTINGPEPESTPNGQIMQTQTVTVEQGALPVYDAPSRLHSRGSFGNSWNIFRMGSFRSPS